jgi:hypothetical protein
MEFNHFLSSFYPDTNYGGAKLYRDMVEQAKAADDLGYGSVSIPEHHLINVLLTPAPLQMAVRVASETRHLKIVTAVAVLPLHDNTLVCTQQELIDRLGLYADAGVDEIALNVNIGFEQSETLDAMQRFAEEIIPLFSKRKRSPRGVTEKP